MTVQAIQYWIEKIQNVDDVSLSRLAVILEKTSDIDTLRALYPIALRLASPGRALAAAFQLPLDAFVIEAHKLASVAAVLNGTRAESLRTWCMRQFDNELDIYVTARQILNRHKPPMLSWDHYFAMMDEQAAAREHGER